MSRYLKCFYGNVLCAYSIYCGSALWSFDFPDRRNRGSDDDDDEEEEEGEVDEDDEVVVKEDKNKSSDGSEGKASDIEEETVKKTSETSEVHGVFTSVVVDGNSNFF